MKAVRPEGRRDRCTEERKQGQGISIACRIGLDLVDAGLQPAVVDYF